MVANKYGISTIHIETKAHCFCPLGNDWYTNEFDIELEPDEMIPDYCALDSWIEENINGKEMIVEDAVGAVFSYMAKTYYPFSLEVTSRVEDAKHCTVTVTKSE